VDDFIEECAAFPHGRNDDQVDQMTQALRRIRTRPPVQTQPSYVYGPYSRSDDEYAWMN
jgi:hypothetical protein